MDFTLRDWRRDDEESVCAFADNPNIARNLRDIFPHPYTARDARGYIESCVNADPARQLCRAIEIGGRAAGSIGLFLGTDVYRRNAELGYWLAEPYWGRGVMRRAIAQLCAEGFRRFDIVRIYAEPYARNTGSCKALEHAGFALEGVLRQSVCKNGEQLDACVYALLRP